VKLPAKFQSLFSCSQSPGKIFLLEPHFKATRNFSGPKKIPRAYFDLLHLCAKIYPKRLTLSASNPQAKKPPKGIIMTWLLWMKKVGEFRITENFNWKVGGRCGDWFEMDSKGAITILMLFKSKLSHKGNIMMINWFYVTRKW
jgi:hypothetical protein